MAQKTITKNKIDKEDFVDGTHGVTTDRTFEVEPNKYPNDIPEPNKYDGIQPNHPGDDWMSPRLPDDYRVPINIDEFAPKLPDDYKIGELPNDYDDEHKPRSVRKRTKIKDGKAIVMIWEYMKRLDEEIIDEVEAEMRMWLFMADLLNEYEVSERDHKLVDSIWKKMRELQDDLTLERYTRREKLWMFMINLMKENDILDVLGEEQD